MVVLRPLPGAARAAAPGRYSAWFACGQPKLCLVVPRRRLLVLACYGAEQAGERVERLERRLAILAGHAPTARRVNRAAASPRHGCEESQPLARDTSKKQQSNKRELAQPYKTT